MRLRPATWPPPVAIAAGVAALMALLAIVHLALGEDVRGDLWHLDQERNLPATFSAALLAAGGLASAYAGRERLLGTRLPWLAFGALLLLMSLDEFGELHERLENATGVDWQVLYLPVALIAGLAWLSLVRRLHGGPRVAMVAGAGLWVIAQALEDAEWAEGDVRVDHYYELAFIEELLEMAGSALFLLAIYVVIRAAASSGEEPAREASSV